MKTIVADLKDHILYLEALHEELKHSILRLQELQKEEDAIIHFQETAPKPSKLIELCDLELDEAA